MELFKKGYEATDKFDYFICSIAGAIFAYDAEHYIPHRLHFDVHLFDPVSLLLLAISFCFGLMRIDASRMVTKYNHNSVDFWDKALHLAKKIQNPEREHGWNEQQLALLHQQHQEHQVAATIADKRIWDFARRASVFQKFRNLFLFVGFLAIFFAKLLLPYAPDASDATNGANQPPQIQLQTTQTLVSPRLSQVTSAQIGNTQTNATKEVVRP